MNGVRPRITCTVDGLRLDAEDIDPAILLAQSTNYNQQVTGATGVFYDNMVRIDRGARALGKWFCLRRRPCASVPGLPDV
ncbi:hypothetical protein So717_21320 [Roseobacter cerasinus]|uniref:Uncharacterized protein n=1 Tax=Roseobacter cerasinus TaxID=2602289 RepID=A0A640VQT2_9RHOB|nr:hypothetical protein So717_21320 [Roseobacter cerasinus]